jgi:bifunctional non-homologous end joining protein LigD
LAKTSASRGLHVNVRIAPHWSFDEVRRAALTVSREIERRLPTLATSKWWKEERHGVFLDYNQNAKDRSNDSIRVFGKASAGRPRLYTAHMGRSCRL